MVSRGIRSFLAEMRSAIEKLARQRASHHPYCQYEDLVQVGMSEMFQVWQMYWHSHHKNDLHRIGVTAALRRMSDQHALTQSRAESTVTWIDLDADLFGDTDGGRPVRWSDVLGTEEGVDVFFMFHFAELQRSLSQNGKRVLKVIVDPDPHTLQLVRRWWPTKGAKRWGWIRLRVYSQSLGIPKEEVSHAIKEIRHHAMRIFDYRPQDRRYSVSGRSRLERRECTMEHSKQLVPDPVALQLGMPSPASEEEQEKAVAPSHPKAGEKQKEANVTTKAAKKTAAPKATAKKTAAPKATAKKTTSPKTTKRSFVLQKFCSNGGMSTAKCAVALSAEFKVPEKAAASHVKSILAWAVNEKGYKKQSGKGDVVKLVGKSSR